MSLPSFELIRAKTISAACALLTDPETEVLAGGTQLLMLMKNRTRTPRRLVELGAIAGLDVIGYSPSEGLTIGARVTLAHLAVHPEAAHHYPAICEAARSVGTPQLQTMGTVAGNLCQDACCLYLDRPVEQRSALAPCHKIDGEVCHVVAGSDLCWANYAGDLAPVLIALGASVTVASPAGQQRRALTTIFSGDGKQPIALSPGALITDIRVPPPPARSGATYLKLRQRQSLEYPLLGVAAAVVLEAGGSCRSARVVLTGVDRGPVVVDGSDVAELPEAAYRRVRPVKNSYGYGPNYRAKMVRPFVTRALGGAIARAREADRD